MDKYGLIGHPLAHSFSQGYFTDKFQSENINAVYLNFDLASIDEFPEVIAAHPTLRGLNVTIPYKQKIIPFLDEIDKEAQAIGAVNVVRVEHRGSRSRLMGFNTDAIGFYQSLQPLLQPHHQRALILGTGGASRAIHYVLTKKLGIECVFVSRFERPDTVSYDKIDEQALQDYPLVVNCTPLGMFPKVNDCPPIPYEALSTRNLLFDLVYNPDTTLFMKKGAERGATVKNGLEMLILQAIASWQHWQ